MRQGFDNDKYLAAAGGAYHATAAGPVWRQAVSGVRRQAVRRLPRLPRAAGVSSQTARSGCCGQLKDDVEIVMAICAGDIEKNKMRGDLGITLRRRCAAAHRRVPRSGRSMWAPWSSPSTPASRRPTPSIKPAEPAGRQELQALSHRRIPLRRGSHRLRRGAAASNDYIETTRPLIVVTAPGPGSGKMATCLEPALPRATSRGIPAGYAKYETFPIWNLPLKHPVNLAYEAATADLNDVNMIDPFHLEAYGEHHRQLQPRCGDLPRAERHVQADPGRVPLQVPHGHGREHGGLRHRGRRRRVSEASRMEILRRYYQPAVWSVQGAQARRGRMVREAGAGDAAGRRHAGAMPRALRPRC